MTVIIAFLGGMLTLLSPCTLPVIPFLFASMKGQKRHLAALLGGMVLMFTALSLLVTVASAWVTQISVVGRWLALAFLTVVALSLISPQIAQRLASRQSVSVIRSTTAAYVVKECCRRCWPGLPPACFGHPARAKRWGPFSVWKWFRETPYPAVFCWPPMAAAAPLCWRYCGWAARG